MIASPTRIEDMKIRQDMLDALESCLALGLTSHAKDIGEASTALKTRIDTKDYTREDKHTEWLKKRVEWKQDMTKPHPGNFKEYTDTADLSSPLSTPQKKPLPEAG